MLNTCVIVGRVIETPEVRTTPKGQNVAHLIIEADRLFRNEDGTLSTDIFSVTLWRGIAEECAAVCHVGSVVAVKGRMQSNQVERGGSVFYNVEIIAEKVAFLSDPSGSAAG